VILITHIESVREQLDHVVAVRFDEESGASVVTSLDALPAIPNGGANMEPAAPSSAAVAG